MTQAILRNVTITGADDSTRISEMVELSQRFPYVEWGILVSLKSEGSYRFPSRNWIDTLSETALNHNLNLSTHICGTWVRRLLVGSLDWAELPSCIQVCQRIQINTHGERHYSELGMMETLRRAPTRSYPTAKQIIFQLDGVNDHLAYAASHYGLNVAGLHDLSAGAGVTPKDWLPPLSTLPTGYAGGLSPDNVIEQWHKIEDVCDRETWIDMERNVRTPDDSALDLAKVEKVLTLCEPFTPWVESPLLEAQKEK